MPPVAINGQDNNDKTGSNGDNKSESNQTNGRTNGENSDKSETESEVRDKEKSGDKDKKLDEGFVSDGSEKKVPKKTKDVSPRRPIGQDIYANLPSSPKKISDKTPIQVLQQVELSDATNHKSDSNGNGERRPAPAPTNVYPGQYPPSPVKYAGPVTPVQKLQTVTLQESQKEVQKSREEGEGRRHPRHEGPKTQMLEQMHVSIPVQQLDINAPIPVSPSHPPSSPPRVRPSKPMPKTSLTPKQVRLDPIPVPTQSSSPSRSPKPSPKPSQPMQTSPKPAHLTPLKPSQVPSRSPSRERAPAPNLPAPPAQSPAISPRPSRKDLPQRKDAQKAVKETPKKGSKDRKDSKDRSLSKDRSPAPRGRQSIGGRKSSSEQSALLDMSYLSEPVASSRLFDGTRNKAPPDFSHKLIALCRKGDWVGVDTVLKYAFKNNIEPDVNAVSENSGWSPLMYAVKENRIQIVEQLLDLGYPVNNRAKDGITALHLACAFAREDTIRMLLVNRADPMIAGGEKKQLPIHVLAQKPTGAVVVPLQLILKSCPNEARTTFDGDGNIALHLALDCGNHGVCRELLKVIPREQTRMKRPNTEETSVHLAVRKKDLDMLKLMVDHGGNVDMQDAEGQTALHLASINGEEPFIKYLHQVGANPNIQDKLERTPLHLATENGHMKTVDFLTEKFKASVHERTKDGSTLMHLASSAGHPGTAMVFMKKGVALHMPNKAGAKPIHMAASKGHVEVVKAIVAKGESVDAKTNEGYTALHIAVQSGYEKVVEALLGMGAAVQLKAGQNGETPLHTAARIENGYKCVEMLIKSGAQINATEDSGETPLHFAAKSGFTPTAKLLLEDKANPSLQNNGGENSLHISVKNCHYPIVEAILQSVVQFSGPESSDAKKLVNQPNKNGESSVHYAAQLLSKNAHYANEDRDTMRLLLTNGGNPLLESTEKGENPVHWCSKSGNTNTLQEIISVLAPLDAQIACNKQAKNGWPPLFYACSQGHPEIIRMLLNQNARVDVFDERGQAALHIAADLGHEDVVELLLASNAFVNVRNKHGMTPLHLAARRGFNSIVKQLVLNHGALLDAFTLTKQTPLHLAAENGQLEVCSTLLQMKADVNATDNHSQTPLHLAAEHDHSEVLKLFLKHNPERLSVPNKNGYTCAHIAAAKGSVAVIKELMRLNQESVINARIAKTKSTTLHLAAEGGHVQVVRVLLQAGAKATDENAEGYTALHLAAKNGHVKVLGALKEQSTAHWKVCSRRIGLTALHVAAAFGQADFVGEMLTQVPATIKSERPLIDPSGDYGITPLHLASQSGHESVVRLLLNSQGVTVDAPTEVVGTIPMHLAAQGGHLLVAGLLISRTTEQLYRADKYGRTPLHLAASYGHRDMVNLLLGQGAQINTQDNRGWSPLHYASRHGFLEVVQLLMDSGADPTLRAKDGRVPLCCAAGAGHFQVLSYLFKKEHNALSLMEDKSFLLDLMVCSKQHENKPIQEFILVSPAPIDTAVKLAKCYENLSQKEKDRTRDLEVACEYCDQIATDLLSIAATTNNAGRLLRAVDHKGTEFLDVLIELERKEVVAQHAVQQYLTNVWIGNMKWAGWKFMALFFSFLVCPVIWVMVSCPIGNRLSKMPIIKFMLYLVSHIFFIVILTFTTVNPWIPLYKNTGQWPHWHEWLLATWVLGVFLAELTNPADRDGLGGIKVVVVFVCFIAVIVHLIAIICGVFDLVIQRKRLEMLYIRNQLLAVALLLSFLEFLNFLTFHHLFGPWAVIIRDLIKDLLRFLAILGIFMVGFSLHVCAIYQPVFPPPDTINGTLPSVGQEFQNPLDTFEMLFFALFGLVEPDYMPPMHLSPVFAKLIMKFVFGIYMMVTVVVLINLLIAMMSNTYQRIQAQSDTEWKFGRAKLIRNMNLTSPTPSPINVFIGIPYMAYEKFDRIRNERKGRVGLATAALAHRPSVVATKQWLQGGRRASRATSHMSRTLVTQTEEGEAPKPITEVINWASIVKKYLEFIGAIGVGGEEAEDKEGGDEDNKSESNA